jgi:hypothetical protein
VALFPLSLLLARSYLVPIFFPLPLFSDLVLIFVFVFSSYVVMLGFDSKIFALSLWSDFFLSQCSVDFFLYISVKNNNTTLWTFEPLTLYEDIKMFTTKMLM